MMLGAGQDHVLGRTEPYDVIGVRGGTEPCFGQDRTI